MEPDPIQEIKDAAAHIDHEVERLKRAVRRAAAQGYPQVRLAALAGVHRNTIRNWLSEPAEPPTEQPRTQPPTSP